LFCAPCCCSIVPANFAVFAYAGVHAYADISAYAGISAVAGVIAIAINVSCFSAYWLGLAL
jgi:hypothetical protein